jgi:hypothetical protein
MLVGRNTFHHYVKQKGDLLLKMGDSYIASKNRFWLLFERTTGVRTTPFTTWDL